jgi:hypothetical protein
LENKIRDSNQDPDQWIQSLEGIKRKLQILGHKISEMDMIIHILQNLTKEYNTTAEILENNLDNNLVSLDRVEEKLRARFEKIQKTRPNQDGTMMVKDMRPGKYKGLCSFCGMYGHKAAQCRNKLKGMNEKPEEERVKNPNEKKGKFFPFSCFICQQKGHKAYECPRNKRNKGKNDEANYTSESTDIALICEDKIDSIFICEDKNKTDKMKEIWVGDTGATCHMVCSDENLINWRSVKQEVTVAGGSSLPVTKIGSLKTKFKNTMSKDADVFFEEVKYVPNLKFNYSV